LLDWAQNNVPERKGWRRPMYGYQCSSQRQEKRNLEFRESQFEGIEFQLGRTRLGKIRASQYVSWLNPYIFADARELQKTFFDKIAQSQPELLPLFSLKK
jgi:hypothetical protein